MTARRHRLSDRRPPECAGRGSRRPRSNRCESRCTACPRRSRKTPPSRADRTCRSPRRSRAAAVRRHRRTVAARTDRQEPAVPRRRDPAASRGTTRLTRRRFSRRVARQSTTGPEVPRPMPEVRRRQDATDLALAPTMRCAGDTAVAVVSCCGDDPAAGGAADAAAIWTRSDGAARFRSAASRQLGTAVFHAHSPV